MEKYGGGGSSDTWAVDPLMVAGNAGYTYTIPSCLADGFYLVRHEIIAVFVASSYPGAQLYPGCHQLNITGGGSTTPTDLVAFPGAYAGTDPGITWDSSSTTYPIPGPTPLTCSGDSAGSAGAASSVASSAVVAASSTSAASSTVAAVETAAVSSAPASSATTLATALAAFTSTAETSSATTAKAAVATDTSSSTSTCSKKRSQRRNKRQAAQE